ncbi:MAG: diguanylate cyclase [Longimicrobiales bacterium]|nr:diguanylate cyclase [Longimicrobiales bacterium]
MPDEPLALDRQVPPRALGLSLVALVVPVVGAFWMPEAFEDYAALLWLLALIPAFLLAYYRGWKGVATALAFGMATLSVTQATLVWLDRTVPELLLGVVVAYVAIALGIGWMAEVFKRDVEEVEELAFTDLLTRLPNRRHARVFLENEFAAAERGRSLAVVLFDLDQFKEYNDRYGHGAGDDALRRFGEILDAHTRKMNLSARFGGEEFLSVLAGSDDEGGRAFAERIRGVVKGDGSFRGEGMTVSAGVAGYHPTMRSPDELLAAADHALYRAKHEGRDCVRLFGYTLLEEARPSRPDGDGGPVDRGYSDEYPRSSEEIGHSPPPVTLLPHQITGFGEGYDVLLVEDDEPVRELIASYLAKEGFSVQEAATVADGIRELRREFDMVVTDLNLPEVKGTELVRATKSRWPGAQVVVITGIRDSLLAAEALEAGADRYLYKPFGMPELRSQMLDILAARKRHLTDREGDGGPGGRQGHEEVTESIRSGALSLSRGAELRETYLKGHSDRVWAYVRSLARVVDPQGTEMQHDLLELACRVHDVGRLRVPLTILEKPEPLTPEEYAEVKKHTTVGRQILESVLEAPLVLGIVTWHHERWDGSGYPDGLSGEAIPLPARIVAVADALDAMTHPRPHRQALSWERAVEEIRAGSGSHFDPGVVDAFEASLDTLRSLYQELAVSVDS